MKVCFPQRTVALSCPLGQETAGGRSRVTAVVMQLGKSGEIAPEGIKRLGQSRSYAQLCMCLVVKVKSDAVRKDCIGTWNVRSTHQDKFEVVKQGMARVNINILGIIELK